MSNRMYQMISSKEEMRWFFDHCIFKPTIVEMYTLEFVCRHKKLTDEEKVTLGLSRHDAEFLATQTVRLNRVKDGQALKDIPWEFEKFYRHASRFNVDVEGYTTSTGEPLPQKSLVVLCYVNPGNAINVVSEVMKKIGTVEQNIINATLNGKTFEDSAAQFQLYGNLESSIKHLQANCKGNVYWMDFDLDVPTWFKENYYSNVHELFTYYFGKGNFVVVDTGGGYHILVRTFAVKEAVKKMDNNDLKKYHGAPAVICKKVDDIYKQGVADGNPEYRNEKGELKYECDLNDSQIPGVPLPGTYQYGRPVTVLNKEDFE